MTEVAVLGGGPAGLTAAYDLAKRGVSVTVFEREPVVGGLSRTEVRDGWRFDLGGHRFYTKVPEIEAIWREVLGSELLERDRLSRIYFQGRFIDYPLSAPELVRKLGPVELSRSGLSYAAARLAPARSDPETFEQWVTQRFGKRLYENFFRSYTEKVWGVPCSELSADWAAQRIRELSLAGAVRDALKRGGGEAEHTSLIRRFLYPRLGPGQMWEAMADRIVDLGGEVRVRSAVEGLVIDGGSVRAVRVEGSTVECDSVISSLPLSVVPRLAEGAPDSAVQAAAELHHRDFLTVALAVDGDDAFPDNWIYVHDPSVRVARIQNYGAWSPAMVPEEGASCLGLEYFCFRSDEIWRQDDDTLIELAKDELARIGLCDPARVRGGWVTRVPMAYPIYDADYASRVGVIRGWIDGVRNLQQVGRNGLHRYNNSDHSMLTGLCAVSNLLGVEADVWSVNAESWYGEEVDEVESPYRLGAVE